jgi:hypothetical protein
VAEEAEAEEIFGEARWPMVGAVLGAMVLTFLLPGEVRFLPRWLLPSVEGALLLTLVFADPHLSSVGDHGGSGALMSSTMRSACTSSAV